jgi:hypothetical protein
LHFWAFVTVMLRGYHAHTYVRPEAAALHERLFGGKERDAAVADRIPPGSWA